MATKYWLGNDGGNEGDWQTAANWSAAGVPNSTDTIIFDGRSTQAVTDGTLPSETGAIAPALVHVKPSFTANIGTVAEPLDLYGTMGFGGTANGAFIYEGTGTMYFRVASDDVAVADTSLPFFIMKSTTGTVNLGSYLNNGANEQKFADIRVIEGTLNILDDTVVDNLYLVPKNDTAAEITVTMGVDCISVKNSTTPSIYMKNGTFTCDSGLTLVEMSNGTFNFGTDLAGSPETAMDITTMRQYGGTFNWIPDDSGDDAFIGDLFIFGGTFDASSATNNDRAKVLGNGAGNDIMLFSSGTMNLKNDKGNITIAAGSQFWNFGGTLITDDNTELGLTYHSP